MSAQILVQTRISRAAHVRLKKRADKEGVTMSGMMKRQLEADAIPSLHDRVRALEIALIKFGIVPEGVRQP